VIHVEKLTLNSGLWRNTWRYTRKLWTHIWLNTQIIHVNINSNYVSICNMKFRVLRTK